MENKMTPTVEEVAKAIYDSGPRFEAMNQVNREAWVEKIALALTQAHKESYVRGLEKIKSVVDNLDPLEAEGSFWEDGQTDDVAQGVHKFIKDAIQSAIDKANTTGEGR